MADTATIPWYRSLSVRVFALSAAVLVLALAGAVAVTFGVGSRRATEEARRAAERATAMQTRHREDTLAQLGLIAEVFADNPAHVAYVIEARDRGDQASLLDFLADRGQTLGFDFAIVLDDQGVVVTRTDQPAARGADLSAQPLVATALEEYRASGVWAEGGRLYYAVVAPLAVDYTLHGYLVIGFALDDSVAGELRGASDAQVVVLASDRGALRVAATTVTPEAGDALARLVESRRAGEADWRSPFEVELAAQRYLAGVAPLGDPDAPVGYTASLAPLEPELRPFRSIGNTLVLGGLAALALSAALLLLFTRRTLEPMAQLAVAARRAAQGEYDQTIPVERDDEVGQLARAFDRLLSDLRERRDTEDYLSQLARTLPPGEPGTPSPTTGVATMIRDAVPTPQAGSDSAASATPASGPRPVVGSVLGDRFEILSTVGAGGMGVVYKAFDRTLGEVVAVKTVKRVEGDETWLQRLKDEIRLARKVTHPNVLRTYEFGETDGMPYITMEYVRGVTLRYLLSRSGRLPYSAGLRLARELCRGLEAAHAVGILHRDIKPENLLIEPSGNAKLMDFGLARPVLRGDAAGHTAAGEVLGTPDYFAPEQLRGDEATVRSDLYSCGVVLYEIFTAHRPFPERTTTERMLAKLRDDPTPPSLHWQRIPPPLESLVLRCLARDPKDRYASATELLADLEPLRA